MKAIYTKLLAFQKKVSSVKKTEVNPFFHSNYADINAYLEEIKPVLNEVGLVLMQPLTNINGKPAITTIIADPESGEVIENQLPLIENNDPQKFGSVVSYTRRYALQSLFALRAEDDDAESSKTPVNASQSVTQASDSPFPTKTGSCDKCGKKVDPKYSRCFNCKGL